MSFFHAKERRVMSPINPKLEQVFKDEIVPGNVIFHAWKCTSGCGHTTLMDKYHRGKRIYCANCECKTEMNYLGETTLVNVPTILNNFTLGRKVK